MQSVNDPGEPLPPNRRQDRLLRFALYTAVGISKTAAAYACYAGLILIHVPHQLALLLTFLLATAVGYVGHSRLVFRTGGSRAAGIYLATALMLYVVNAAALEALVHFDCGPLVSQLLCQAVTIPLGYVLVSTTMRRFGTSITQTYPRAR